MTLHVALIEPQIPPNTGNVMRLCAGADVPLHLIGPLGFSLDGHDVKRAALEYRDKVDLWEHPDWFAFRDAISRDRCIYFTPDARVDYTKAPFRKNSVLVFGNEKDGMPARIVEKHRTRCYRIPTAGEVRSLNLANAVSVVLYEGLRQLGQGGTPPVFEVPEGQPEPALEARAEPRPDHRRGPRPHARPVAPVAPARADLVDLEDDEPNFNLAPRPSVVVPVIEEEEDEINYNVEQKPRVSAHPGRGPRGGAPRGGPRGGGPRGGPPLAGGAPKVGGRPRRGRGGRGKPKP
jgi:tRNA (cytidine/uridine-2'-O-)-methyltransferase